VASRTHPLLRRRPPIPARHAPELRTPKESIGHGGRDAAWWQLGSGGGAATRRDSPTDQRVQNRGSGNQAAGPRGGGQSRGSETGARGGAGRWRGRWRWPPPPAAAAGWPARAQGAWPPPSVPLLGARTAKGAGVARRGFHLGPSLLCRRTRGRATLSDRLKAQSVRAHNGQINGRRASPVGIGA
jgi:hypothetical protein